MKILFPENSLRKWYLVGDPHFKVSHKAETELLVSKFDEIRERCKEQNIQNICLLGDMLNNHKNLDSETLYRVQEWIKDLSKDYRVLVIVGNHDRLNNEDFLGPIHSLASLEGHPNIHFASKEIMLLEEEVTGFKVVGCPYVPNNRFVEALETDNYIDRDTTLLDESINLILAHQEMANVSMDNGYPSSVTEIWPPEYPMMITGHIHKRQKLSANLWYQGTPYQVNWGESGEKGISIIEWRKDDKDKFNWSETFFELDIIKKMKIVMTVEDAFALDQKGAIQNKVTDRLIKIEVYGTQTQLDQLVTSGLLSKMIVSIS